MATMTRPADVPAGRLRARLSRLDRRIRLRRAARGAGKIVAAACGIVLTVMLIDFVAPLSQAARLALWAMVAIGLTRVL